MFESGKTAQVIKEFQRYRLDILGLSEVRWKIKSQIRASWNGNQSLIVKQKLSYFGHIMRKQRSLEKSIMLLTGEGGRRRGRPCMRWKDDIKTVTGLTLSEMVRAVENRDDWRQLITAITRSRSRLEGTR
ncbi:endonuclease-reverse transcriptase [Elysia marginata]|uniref:Endonuclease-reverse transcriptase n=1 Tax=Elysia marginata TaxID=1093978 RepID=A0AAV4GLU6_9GAST|nr:endonuclease-reverse transcriptase [Elysia marginata]